MKGFEPQSGNGKSKIMRNQMSFAWLIIILHLNGYAFAAVSQAWLKRSNGIIENKVNCVFAAHDGENYVLAGTDRAIYRADNYHSIFLPVLQNYSHNPAIHQIYQNKSLPSSLYSATDSGVFLSNDKGKTWTNIFAPLNSSSRKVFCVLADDNAIYAGTAQGLYIRRNSDLTWREDNLEIGRKAITHLVADGAYVYAATDSTILRIKKSTTEVVRVYSIEDRSIDNDDDLVDDGASLKQQIKAIVVSDDQEKIVVASQQMIFTQDHGESWETLPVGSLPLAWVRKLLSYKGHLFAATGKGLFNYINGRWETSATGVNNLFANDVADDQSGHLYLASNDGLFIGAGPSSNPGQINFLPNISPSGSSVKLHLENNPLSHELSIDEVQRLAIEYANVDPYQIKNWHKQSRAKALVPKFSMILNRGDGELYHWDSGPNPDILSKGRDYIDWSASVSWDLSDLVWSSDHTSIDSRSKLMSELRHDILDQVTRLYFERRRIQIELASTVDPNSDISLDKSLRIEELTALLDGLTGGQFSKNNKKQKE